MKIVLVEEAEQDLQDAAFFLNAEATESIPLRFIDSFLSSIEILRDNPEAGRNLFPENGIVKYRNWFIIGFSNWRIIYSVADDAIRILRIVHGARALKAIYQRLIDNE